MTKKKVLVEKSPDAPTTNLTSAEAVQAAFERERPRREPWLPGTPPPRFTPDQLAEQKRFALFVRSVLEGLFGSEVASEPRAFGAWSPVQRQALLEIAKTPSYLHTNAGGLGESLRGIGAMNTAGVDDDRYLPRYVGLRPHSPLEDEVEGEPLWLWLRRRLMGTISQADWVDKAAALDDHGRIEVARRALDNAYQLMRRYPFPADITPDQERDDAANLSANLAPILDVVTTEHLQAAVTRDAGATTRVCALIVDLVLILARRGSDVPDAAWSALEGAMPLRTSEVSLRSLLELLPVERREMLLRAAPLTAHNVQGWVHLETLPPEVAGSLVLEALRGFRSAIVPAVLPCSPARAADSACVAARAA